MPLFIVLDGTDGSGKATQAKHVKESLEEMGKRVKLISFPNYESPYSVFVKDYLNGKFGDSADAINPYAASLFYAMDRYGTWITELKASWNDYDVVVADRYVSSNLIHQASKMPLDKLPEFAEWLEKTEFDILGLPRPDKIIFLDMPRATAMMLSKNRPLKNGGCKDIHEEDISYMEKSYNTARKCAELMHWDTVYCAKPNLLPLSEEEITTNIMKIL